MAALLVATVAVTLASAASCREDTGDAAGQGIRLSEADIRTTTPPAKGALADMTWNLPQGEPRSLDPIKSYDYSADTVLANVCESLLRQQPDFSLAPGLASSYAHPDPKTWVYQIRDGVRFSDGRPLTAADVVYSLRRNLDPALGSYWAVPFYSNVAAITQSGPREVQVRLKQPDPLFNRMMATTAGAVGQRSFIAKAGASYGTPNGGLMCTGPYRVERWVSGSRIVLVANDSYWDARRQPQVKRVTFRFLTNEATIVSALRSGELDGTFQVPTAGIAPLRKSNAGRLYYGKSTEWYAFRYTSREGPTSDPRIREALSLAVDRAAVARVAFGGAAVPSVSPIQPTAWGYGTKVFESAAKKLEQPEQDLDRARDLVRRAGSPTEPIVVAIRADVQSDVRAAAALTAAAKRIGLTVNVRPLPQTTFSTLFFDAAARQPYHVFASPEYGAAVADPIVTLSEFTPRSAYNYSDYDNPAVTGPITRALTTTDPERRARLVARAERALVENHALLNLANPVNVTFVNRRLTGLPVSLSYLYYPWLADVGASR